MPKPKAYKSAKEAPMKEQVKTHREFLRSTPRGQTRTTDQILQAAKVTQAEKAGVRTAMGSKAKTSR